MLLLIAIVRMDYQVKESKVLIRVEGTPALWSQESCPHCAAKTVRGYQLHFVPA